MKALFTLFLAQATIAVFGQITPPAQPVSGPGGSDYTNLSVTEYDYGTNMNGDGFWLFEPASPVPDSANVILFCHGMGDTNPMLYGAFIRHLVQKGNIVIYPRYQRDINANTALYNDSCARGVQRALDTMQLPGHVLPRLYNYFIVGHSVGGVLAANMTQLYATYNLPKPLATFSIEPGAPALNGIILSDYSSFPADVKYLVVIGSQDVIVGTSPGTMLYNSTTAVPTSHKNLVEIFPDTHGNPGVGSTHNEPLAYDSAFNNGETNLFIQLSSGVTDAVDYFCTWKLMDALMDCAANNQNCDVAFGDTPKQRSMGSWSDGTAVAPLKITPSAATSITDIENETGMTIFPNPSANGFSLQVPGFKTGSEIKLDLFDMTGRKIYGQNIASEITTVDHNFSSGVYLYQVKNAREILSKGKVVVE
ncbi:MAG: hypothetical protein JWO06_3740 [Bacteroidota bacterium]|nr:hypothetical protein [Bacteroidota bacterium]